MKYAKPMMSVFSANDIREFQALAGSGGCGTNEGSCGINVCVCVSFCFSKK